MIDAAIQRFEFMFELAWKLAQAISRSRGVDTSSPRAAIKKAFKQGLIINGEGWLEMLEARNRMSHIYDEAEALKIYGSIKDVYFRYLWLFQEEAGKVVREKD